ncbi:NACHT domain-containing protein [Streptomyces umbrinus]|uniref:NACHT domain-containing protein n=1 Tax=Streptomyces umbrinus TaxID=67370 RepID=UPI00341C3AD7
MEAARIVELWVPATGRVGSGYLLSPTLVLTACHVLLGNPPGARVEIRPLEPSGDRQLIWAVAKVSWPTQLGDEVPELDAALLSVADPMWEPAFEEPLVRFGTVLGNKQVACWGVGFPQSETRPDGVRDTLPVNGEVDPWLGMKSAKMTVHVNKGVAPHAVAGRSGWAGASGTALFCGPLLIGVLVIHRSSAGEGRLLRAVPAVALAAAPGFEEVLAAHGLRFSVESAPRPDHERFLHPYLSAVTRATQKHPYPGILNPHHELPPLTSVYLRQEMRDERAQQAVTADEVLARDDAVVLVANAGGGKSTLLRLWAWKLARGFTIGSPSQVPVLVQAAALITEPNNGTPFGDILAAAVTSDLSPWLHEALPAELFRGPPAHRAKWLVLIDAMDEVTAEHIHGKLLETLTALDSRFYRIVLATRPSPDLLSPAIKDATQYAIEPFTATGLRTVARNWFSALHLPDPDSAVDIFSQAIRRAGLNQLARTPLVTALLCQIHADNPRTPLPAGRTALYGQFLEMLRRRRDTPGPGSLRDQTTAQMARYGPTALSAAHNVLDHLPILLEHLAATRLGGNTTEALGVVSSHPVASRPVAVPAGTWSAFLDTSLRRSGLLTVQSDNHVFLHQTLLEYLAACHVFRDPPLNGRFLQRAFCRPRRLAPGRDAPGVRPRLWGWRYWCPPAGTSSYSGFVIEMARGIDDQTVRLYLALLSSPRAGLHGCRFIAEQILQGTLIPTEVATAAAELAFCTATARAEKSRHRVEAAGYLANLGDARAADIWHTLAADTSLGSYDLVRAARTLTELEDPRAADIWNALATGAALDDRDRTRGAAELAALHDPRIADVWHALATDTNAGGDSRVHAAIELAALHDPRTADAWHALATDTNAGGDSRVHAAIELAALHDPRIADVWHALASDTNADAKSRVQAGSNLADLGDPRDGDTLYAIATDTTLDGSSRVKAGVRLAALGDPRVAERSFYGYFRNWARPGPASPDDS